MTDIVETIAEYLSMGGLFNPEMMEHDTVRNLIIECRAEITRLRTENKRLRDVLSQTYALASHWETTAKEAADFVDAALKENSK